MFLAQPNMIDHVLIQHLSHDCPTYLVLIMLKHERLILANTFILFSANLLKHLVTPTQGLTDYCKKKSGILY